MNMSIAITRTTRRIHSLAVKLHCAALYRRILAAEANTDAAYEASRQADAIYLIAKRDSQDAAKAHQRARLDEMNVIVAAEAEANQIGGQL